MMRRGKRRGLPTPLLRDATPHRPRASSRTIGVRPVISATASNSDRDASGKLNAPLWGAWSGSASRRATAAGGHPTCACRKPKSGRVGDAARQPGHATRCVRSAETGRETGASWSNAQRQYCTPSIMISPARSLALNPKLHPRHRMPFGSTIAPDQRRRGSGCQTHQT